MAATVSAWSKPGAWALDSEEHEAELLQHNNNTNTNTNDVTADFPSLADAAATKPKKKKPHTLSLAQFTAKSHQDQDLIMLPTAPRHRTGDELNRDRNRLGGGFTSYGDRPHRNSGGDEVSNSRWGSSRVSDEPRGNGSFSARNRDSNRELAPSRADEIDNWAAAKESTVRNGFENQRRERERERGGFFDSQSRADESDSWVSNKNFAPSEGRRVSSNGGGFERERKVGFGTSGGADSDNWNRKKGEFNGGNESRSARPKLNLQRSLSVTVGDGSQEAASGNVTKPKDPNPFGEARPREQVLAEKGKDWKKIDEQLETMTINEVVVDKKDELGKRGFGSANGCASLPDERTLRSWRKPESDDARPKSVKVEDGPSEEN